MKRNYLYIDDSGDTGFKTSSSSHFLIAALLVIDEDQKQALTDAIDLYRKSLGWSELDEFKFNTTNKQTVLNLINIVKDYNFSAHIMILDKNTVDPKDIPTDKTSLYYRIIKDLLLKIEVSNPIITIDGRAGKQYAKEIKTYLRKNLRENGVHGSRIYLVDSRKNPLIQLTDIIVGSVARSYKKDKTDSQIYVNALKNKIINIYDFKL